VDYVFRWFGKKFLTTEQQEAAGILSAEVRARLAQSYAEGQQSAAEAPAEAATPGQTALFNNWEDAVECAKCGGRMVRTGSCYTCRDCGTNTGCSSSQTAARPHKASAENAGSDGLSAQTPGWEVRTSPTSRV